MIISIKKIKALAQQQEDENWEFREFLKFYDDMSEEELDQLVFRIAQNIESSIDCTLCGQCCRELKPTLSEQDQLRLAEGLHISVKQLREQYLEYSDEDGGSSWHLKSIPCVFLNHNKCTVYQHRPQDCRNYPYLHEPEFSSRTWGMIERTFTCPIVYNVMEELKKALRFYSRE